MAKKIGAIISLVIIGALIIATIIMANINLNYGIDCVKPDSVYVQTKNDTVKVSSEQKDKIVEMISGASNEKFLTALFNGEADKKVEIRSEKSTISTPSNYYVRYHYTSKQDLIVNGKEYKDADGKVETFEELVFVVNPAEGEAEFKVFVIPESDSSNSYNYYFVLDADFESLYEYLSENFSN